MKTYSYDGITYTTEEAFRAAIKAANPDRILTDEEQGMQQASYKDGDVAFSILSGDGNGGVYVFRGSDIVRR